MRLNELTPGKSARSESVGGEGALRQHFLDMGVIPGAEVTMMKLAPMGDPMELLIHGYELTLRLADAEQIVIVPLVDENFPVENLGSDIGLLEGSGPTKEDLFVLAGHNHLNNEEQGPFAKLSSMEVSDLIFVQGAKNESRKFVVYANEKFAEDDVEGLLEMARPGCMILITCEDESIEGGYINRRVIFAKPVGGL